MCIKCSMEWSTLSFFFWGGGSYNDLLWHYAFEADFILNEFLYFDELPLRLFLLGNISNYHWSSLIFTELWISDTSIEFHSLTILIQEKPRTGRQNRLQMSMCVSRPDLVRASGFRFDLTMKISVRSFVLTVLCSCSITISPEWEIFS